MNVRDTPYHGETLVTRAKLSMAMSKDKKAVTLTQGHVINPINSTSRSKVNVVLGIMNVQDTLFKGDTPLRQIW